MPAIVVQQIVVRWTKKSRGGENATKRNAVADAFTLSQLPAHDFPFALVHQQLNFTEETNFESPQISQDVESIHLPTALELLCMNLNITSGKVLMRPLEGMACLGAPPRNLQFKQIQLSIGQWGRFVSNGRSGLNNDWSYHKRVTNIAFVESIEPDIFLSEPNQYIQMMADLW